MQSQRKMSSDHGNSLTPGNGLALEELSGIEENAYRSNTEEARIILRLSAALREAMQVSENALALIAALRPLMGSKVGRIKTTHTKPDQLLASSEYSDLNRELRRPEL